MTARVLSYWRWILAQWSRWRTPARPMQLGLMAPLMAVASPAVLLTATAPALEADPAPVLPAPRRRRQRDVNEPESAAWHFKTTILDRLDEYFVCLRRVRRHDPEAYALFARVGLSIPANVFFSGNHENSRERLRHSCRPAFGGILFGNLQATDDRVCPSFAYFRKLRTPCDVQRVPGVDCYEFTVVFDDRRAANGWMARLTVPAVCYVALDRQSGEPRLLKQRVTLTSPILRRAGAKRERFTLTEHRWDYPTWLREFKGAAAPSWLTYLFTMAIVTYEDTIDRIVVRASRHGTVAAFGIQLARAKYFFADRSIEAAADGRRKRIFHAVTEHDRRTRHGATRVRAHYRGARHFDWNENRIDIVFPTRTSILRFPEPAVQFNEEIPEEQRFRYYDSEQAGERFAQALSE